MAFDWIAFLTNHNVEYVEKGPSVTRGNIAVRCPFCLDDPSHHMSIHLEGRGWRCFRRPDEHKGRSPVALVAKLIGVSYAEAGRICGVNTSYLPEDFMSQINNYLEPARQEVMMRTLRLPAEFRKLDNGLGRRAQFFRYLINKRGFDAKDIPWLAEQFDLRFAVKGAFHHRIIFPITFEKKLITWTGRAINPTMSLRYLSLPTDQEAADRLGLPPALEPISSHLLWYDRLKSFQTPKVLYIVEGPFDALKVWYLGQQWGIVATCFFTATASEGQLDELHELLPRFRRKYLLLDQNTLPTAIRLHDMLATLGVQVRTLPKGIKDPALLTSVDFLRS